MRNGVVVPTNKYKLYLKTNDPNNEVGLNGIFDAEYFVEGRNLTASRTNVSLIEVGIEVSIENGDDYSGTELVLNIPQQSNTWPECELAREDVGIKWINLCENIVVTEPTPLDEYTINPQEAYSLTYKVKNNNTESVTMNASLTEPIDALSITGEQESSTISANNTGDIVVKYYPTVSSNVQDKLKLNLSLAEQTCKIPVNEVLLKAVDAPPNACTAYKTNISLGIIDDDKHILATSNGETYTNMYTYNDDNDDKKKTKFELVDTNGEVIPSGAYKLYIKTTGSNGDDLFTDAFLRNSNTVEIMPESGNFIGVATNLSSVDDDFTGAQLIIELPNDDNTDSCPLDSNDIGSRYIAPVDPGSNCPDAQAAVLSTAFLDVDPASPSYSSDYDSALDEIIDELNLGSIDDIDSDCSYPEKQTECTDDQQSIMDTVFSSANLNTSDDEYKTKFEEYLESVKDYPASCNRESQITCSADSQIKMNTRFGELDANSSDFDAVYNSLVDIYSGDDEYKLCTIPTKQQATSGVAPEDMITPEADNVPEDELDGVADTAGVVPGGQLPSGTAGGTVMIPDARPSAPVYGAAAVGQSGTIQGSTGPELLLYPALLGLAGLLAKRKEEDEDTLLK